jgi:regulator of sigma E protease
MIYGSPVDSPEAMSARVEGVDPGSAAAAAGFEPGDLVVAIDGEPIANFAEMQRIVSENPQRKLDITVQRRGAEVVLSAVPKSDKDILGNRIGRLGIHGPLPAKFAYQPVSPPQAVWMGMQETWFVVDQTFKYIGGVITGHRAADQLSGPIGIARVIGKAANISFGFVIHIAAVISVSIGLLNLFPIPLLDGGHLLFYLIEGIRGRPLSERAQELGFRIGLAIVLMLMIFATFNDIVHLTTS